MEKKAPDFFVLFEIINDSIFVRKKREVQFRQLYFSGKPEQVISAAIFCNEIEASKDGLL